MQLVLLLATWALTCSLFSSWVKLHTVNIYPSKCCKKTSLAGCILKKTEEILINLNIPRSNVRVVLCNIAHKIYMCIHINTGIGIRLIKCYQIISNWIQVRWAKMMPHFFNSLCVSQEKRVGERQCVYQHLLRNSFIFWLHNYADTSKTMSLKESCAKM